MSASAERAAVAKKYAVGLEISCPAGAGEQAPEIPGVKT
jgi:hypothetical protein